LDAQLAQVCGKARLLELIHDFVVFDAGIKKLARQNQYFGVKAAQEFVRHREGGIIWHTQGSGKSLTMLWLAKWIREHRPESRVLIVTDRSELDEQIEKVFLGVDEAIYRTRSGADLIDQLGRTEESLICSLVHKFGSRGGEGERDEGAAEFINAFRNLPPGFQARGDLHVFVDECHRTQSGDLHEAMKAVLPNALFIGFTGTPLLAADKKRSIEVFGRYIHTYKFDQAVREGVVLDLRYEARDIDQSITSQKKIDDWFEVKTKGLNDLAKAQLKQKWGTMQRVLSSQSRLEKIVADILLDMNTRPRLADGHGNALLVAGSIYEACKFHELFAQTELKGRCAIVSSYAPATSDTKGESTGEGETDNLFKYGVYRQMLADWFGEPPETALGKVEKFEKEVKKKFVDEPGQMKLLIVVDKLLTGFDAPSATYLYIDKQMRDHGLFQAICRVNRLDGESKDYGYIVDYKDLFKSLEGAVRDYTGGAFDAYDKDDVQGLLKDRLRGAREDLENAREAVRALCEPVEPPRDSAAYLHFFCAKDSGNSGQLKENEPRRLKLYKYVATLLRTYAAIAAELEQAGYGSEEIARVKHEVDHYSKVRDEVKLASGDYIDIKAYEPAMRHLIDTYIHADQSEKISAFDDLSLIQLIVERVAAPLVVGDEAVRLAVIDKLAWIRRQQAEFAQQPRQSQREMVSGESHYFLGRRYRLRVHEQAGPARVALRGVTSLNLFVPPGTDATRREEILNRWYRQQLRALVPPMLEKWQSALGVQAADWGIKRMKTKWGSCNPAARRIWLNLELAKKPVQCVEYIVVHELAHLRERRHDERFAALMDECLPHWDRRRDELNAQPVRHEAWDY
jgi:type I restriction enzyme R subunit